MKSGTMQKRIHPDGYIMLYDSVSKKGILEHRYVMEQFLGRKLKTNETVHHKDHDKTNNDISNLEILDVAEHSKLHGLERGREYVKLKCPWCNKIFEKPRNNTFLCKPSNKYKCTCCSNSCRGKLCKQIQINGGLTEEIEKAMNENVIEEFISYQ